MSKTIITVHNDTEQHTNIDCIEAQIFKHEKHLWCNLGYTYCKDLQCTEKTNSINVKVIK